MLTRLTLFLAVLAGLLLLRRASSHRPAAVGLALLFLLDVLRLVTAPRPALHVLDVLLYAAWYAAETWTVAVTLFPVGRALATLLCGALWLLVGVFLDNAQSLGLLPRLEPAWCLVFAVSASAQLWLAALHRGTSTPILRAVASPSAGVGVWITLSSVTDIAGPWLLQTPGKDWYAGQWPAITTWLGITVWEVGRWRRGRSRPAS